MHTISIVTSQNIELEYELGSLGDRILGSLLDWLIIFAYVFVVLVLFNLFNIQFGGYEFVLFLLFLPVIFYSLLCETLLNGQSAGKRVRGIRVISLSGLQPSFSQYLIRWVFRFIDVGLTSSFVGFVLIAVTDKHQRLGDIIAGTVLVKIKPRTSIDDTWYQAADDTSHAVTYPEVINLRDKDIQLIKDIMVAAGRTGNVSLMFDARRKVEDTLGITSQHEDSRLFLQIVLADYNYLTSQL